MPGDRTFARVALCAALGYFASTPQVQTSFLTNRKGSRVLPILFGGVSALCALVMNGNSDPNPFWPFAGTCSAQAGALVCYACVQKLLGFVIPTGLSAGVLSDQIGPRAMRTAVSGILLSVMLFLIFRFALILGRVAFPKGWL